MCIGIVRSTKIRQILLYSKPTPPPTGSHMIVGIVLLIPVKLVTVPRQLTKIGTIYVYIYHNLSEYDRTLSRTWRIWIGFKFCRFLNLKWKKT